MELKPTKAQILWLAEKYNTVPLSTTLPATVTPTQVLQKLKTVSRHCYAGVLRGQEKLRAVHLPGL